MIIMPNANCFLKDKTVDRDELEKMVLEWAEVIGVDIKDICINIVTDFIQLGKKYSAMVCLYLPSLWSNNDKERIQMELLNILAKYLRTTEDNIFIVTSIVESGNVVENGEIVKW